MIIDNKITKIVGGGGVRNSGSSVYGQRCMA